MSPVAAERRSRRRVQWTLAVLAAVPLASASREIMLGPQGVPGGSPDVTPTVDSAFRYANVFKFVVGPVIWSQFGRIERSTSLTYALASIFLGGFTRLRPWQQRGRPHPVTVGAVVVEIRRFLIRVPVQERRVEPRSLANVSGDCLRNRSRRSLPLMVLASLSTSSLAVSRFTDQRCSTT